MCRPNNPPKEPSGHLRLAHQLCFLEVGVIVKIGAVNQTEKGCHNGNVGHRCGSKDIYMIVKAWTKGHHPQKLKSHPPILRDR